MSCNGPENIHPHISNHEDFTAIENGPATAEDEVNRALNVAIVIVMPPFVIK